MKSPRHLAVEALLRVDSQSAWSNLVSDDLIEKYKLDPRDGAFFSALFRGVLERQVTLDACIAAHSKTPPEKLSPAVLEVLRAGVYQLLYMDSVPDHAAVSESVGLVKKLRKAQAAGFVNFVLRSFLRDGKRVPVPDSPLELRLSVEYSCPRETVSLLINSYGEETARRFLAASLGRPPLFCRVNTLLIQPAELVERLAAHGVEAEADPELPACLRLSNTGSVRELPEFKRGFFHVQDRSSQLCCLALGPQPGDRVLDCCAAPGGKSFTIAQLMGGEGEIIAADIHAQRLGLIAERAKKLKIKCVKTREMDASVPDESIGLFDKILCDVPCSGLGVIRRKPEIKRKTLPEFAGLPDLQYKILETASHYLKAGGRLIYSTCTLNPAENERVVERFLSENPGFSAAELPPPLGGGTSRTMTAESEGDGFFVAAVTK